LNVWCWSDVGVPCLLESLGSLTSLVRLAVEVFDFLMQAVQGCFIGWVALEVVVCCGVDPLGGLGAGRLVVVVCGCGGAGEAIWTHSVSWPRCDWLKRSLSVPGKGIP